MPMMYGFGTQRRQMLESELQRLVAEMPQLGMQSMYLVGPFSQGDVGPKTVLDLVVVQQTENLFTGELIFGQLICARGLE